MRLWSIAIASGVPNELYWSCTPRELGALFEAIKDRERNHTLRFALIAATICNVHRKAGARLVQPSDFVWELPKEEDYMSAEAGVSSMDSWAQSVNVQLQGVPPEAEQYYTKVEQPSS